MGVPHWAVAFGARGSTVSGAQMGITRLESWPLLAICWATNPDTSHPLAFHIAINAARPAWQSCRVVWPSTRSHRSFTTSRAHRTHEQAAADVAISSMMAALPMMTTSARLMARPPWRRSVGRLSGDVNSPLDIDAPLVVASARRVWERHKWGGPVVSVLRASKSCGCDPSIAPTRDDYWKLPTFDPNRCRVRRT